MGCMMAYRLALERSALLARFSCHGGLLVQKKGAKLAAEKRHLNLASMPAYMTGGAKDLLWHVHLFVIVATTYIAS